MIVGANSFTEARAATERATPVKTSAPGANATAAASDERAPDPLAMLENFVESAALSRKAFAEDRLKHLKEQMNTLALFNLAPGFLAGHTARMAKDLESAATDFAASFKTLAGLEQAQTPNGSQAAAPAATGANALPPAYLDILTEEPPGGFDLNSQDVDTAASFMTTAHQLRGVVEMISEGSKDKASLRWTTDGARQSTSRVVDLMARLEAPSAFSKVFW